MKIKSYQDICEFERLHPAYCGLLVAAILKDLHLVGTIFAKDGHVCFRQSGTFHAALAKRDLVAAFDQTSATEGWLHWIEGHRGGVTQYGPPTQVWVDWRSQVFRVAKQAIGTSWAYGCLEDVRHALYDQKERAGRTPLNQPASETATEVKAATLLSPLGDARSDIEMAEQVLANESETTRRTLIDARLGQGAFRESLMFVWSGKCALTRCSNAALLRASHIKPWRISDNRERLDRFNGLLLSPVIDAAFDRGLISFSDAGDILFKSEFRSQDRQLLGLGPTLRLVYVYDENKPYLAEHRKLHGFLSTPSAPPS